MENPSEQLSTTERNDALLDELASDLWGDDQTDEQAGQSADDEDAEIESGESEEDDLDEIESDDFDDDEDDDEEAPADAEPPLDLTFKANGKTVEPDSLDELKRLAAAGVDYSKNVRETADERRAYAEARDRYGKGLETLQGVLAQMQPEEPDWDQLRQELDPGEYSARVLDHQKAQQKVQQVQAELERVRGEQTEEQRQQLAEHVAAERDALLKAVEGWAEEKDGTLVPTPAAKAEVEGLMDFGKAHYGFTDQHFENITDHRLLLMLRDAKAGVEIRSGGKEKIRQKAKTARTLPPGGRPRQTESKSRRRQAQKSREKARATGHVRDVTRALEHSDLLDDLL